MRQAIRWGGACFLGVLLSSCGTPPPSTRLPTGYPLNGGFERGFDSWGTGYIEDSVRKYHPPEESLLPYWMSPSAKATDSRLYLESKSPHSGAQAVRIEHRTPEQPQHYGTLAQRFPVKENAVYEAEVWTRVEGPPGATWFLTMVREWEPHVNLPLAGVWTKTVFRFVTEKKQTEAELRFVIQGPGTYWIDDVSLWELTR